MIWWIWLIVVIAVSFSVGYLASRFIFVLEHYTSITIGCVFAVFSALIYAIAISFIKANI